MPFHGSLTSLPGTEQGYGVMANGKEKGGRAENRISLRFNFIFFGRVTSMRFPVVLRYALLCLLTLAGTEALQAQAPPNPFAPPQARLQYAPNRNYDLQH